MEAQHLSSDPIDTLPPNIIEKILTLMPFRDALRTSILSRKWRYCWASIPKLVFDNRLIDVSVGNEQFRKYKLFYAIYQVLLLHRGPLLELSLFITNLQICSEIDPIILHLSRSNTIEKFTLHNSFNNSYKLPTSFFSLRQLTYLCLRNCVFEPPSTFNGFSRLTSLYLLCVDITTRVLQLFLSSCPLLTQFFLIGIDKDLTGGDSCKFVELFECLPMIEVLYISKYYIKCFAAGGVPEQLPSSLVHLTFLTFACMCLTEQDDLSAALCLIRSSPNLEKIRIMIKKSNVSQTLMDIFELQDDPDFRLDHLKELEMQYFRNLAPEMEFVKLVVLKSPMLKKVRIKLDKEVSVDGELKMLRGLLRNPFQRASSPVEFIVER